MGAQVFHQISPVPSRNLIPLTYETDREEIENLKKQLSSDPGIREAIKQVLILNQSIAADQQTLAEARQNLQQVVVQKNKVATELFYSIFYGKKPLPEQVNTLFATYLSDGSIFIENKEGKCTAKLISMKPIIQYLKDNQDKDIKTCDFRPLKSEVGDIKTLADYLKDPACKIRAIALNSHIPADSKATLAETVAAKKGLQVKYFE